MNMILASLDFLSCFSIYVLFCSFVFCFLFLLANVDLFAVYALTMSVKFFVNLLLIFFVTCIVSVLCMLMQPMQICVITK